MTQQPPLIPVDIQRTEPAPFGSADCTQYGIGFDGLPYILKKVEKHNPVVPVIANVRAAPVSDAKEIAGLLVEQVTGQVRWRETVEWFAANNVTQLYEIGSGKVLTGLARRIDKTVTGVAVNGAADIDQLLATLIS